MTSKGIVALVLTGVFLVAGCTPQQAVRRNADPATGQTSYQSLAAVYLKDGKPAYDSDDLLETLRAAKAFHDAGLWAYSREAFAKAHEKLSWKEDTIDTPEEVANFFGTTLTSSAFGAYQGKIFEGCLIEYYQALNALMLGDEATARVAFNRLEVRQHNAVAQLKSFAETVTEQSGKAMEDNDDKKAGQSLDKVQEASRAGLKSIPEGLEDAYLRNAAGDVLSAVFRVTSSARQDKSLSRVGHMLEESARSTGNPEGAALVAGLREDIESGGARLSGRVFILLEDGRGPGFEEFRIDLPVFLASSKVLYSGVALPSFVPGAPSLGSVSVVDTDARTVVLTDINNLAALEFKKAYSGIVAKSVLSAVIKTAVQYAANDEADRQMGQGSLGSLLFKMATAAAQYHLTRADLRAWDNLPNTIQMAVVERPADGKLALQDATGRILANIDLPDAANVLVMVRSMDEVPEPAVHVAALGGVGGQPKMTAVGRE